VFGYAMALVMLLPGPWRWCRRRCWAIGENIIAGGSWWNIIIDFSVLR
jgi:hypothetical protein